MRDGTQCVPPRPPLPLTSEASINAIARNPIARVQDAGVRSVPTSLERGVAVGLIATQLFVRIVYAFHHAIDSDEPQHLHVAWGWAHGLLPYRDFFDNHAPLFSALASPLIRLIGERPDIVQLVRLMVLPLAGIAMVSTWLIARRL